jgi:hypothetical protein
LIQHKWFLYDHNNFAVILCIYVMSVSSSALCIQNGFYVITFVVVDRSFWIFYSMILGYCNPTCFFKQKAQRCKNGCFICTWRAYFSSVFCVMNSSGKSLWEQCMVLWCNYCCFWHKGRKFQIFYFFFSKRGNISEIMHIWRYIDFFFIQF